MVSELERRGQEIADAMGRYRGTEPLVEAVRRMSEQLFKAERELERSRAVLTAAEECGKALQGSVLLCRSAHPVYTVEIQFKELEAAQRLHQLLSETRAAVDALVRGEKEGEGDE